MPRFQENVTGIGSGRFAVMLDEEDQPYAHKPGAAAQPQQLQRRDRRTRERLLRLLHKQRS